MMFSQGFRVLNSCGKRHASKVLCANSDFLVRSVTSRSRDETFCNLTGSSLLVKSVENLRSALNVCVKNSRLVSTDSRDTSLDDERHKLKNDPEIQAWMSQIAQDFDTAPFQALVDQHHMQDIHGRSSKEGAVQAASDIEVEDFGYIEDDEDDFEDPAPERNVPVPLERGRHGVFDVEEIVAVLEDENGVDIQVVDIPPEARFVDHMVVVSGKSLRHMRAMAASIEWLYKKKKKKSDRHFKLEGRDCKDWFAMDLGNIAVHIFTPEARQHYDIETLWTLGPEHDDQRHYVHDDSLNLSAADLFWLESSSRDHASSSHCQTSEVRKEPQTDGSESDMIFSSDQCQKVNSKNVDDHTVDCEAW